MAQGTRRLLSPILTAFSAGLILIALPTGGAGKMGTDTFFSAQNLLTISNQSEKRCLSPFFPAGIIFSHKFHVEMNMDCEVCHAAADASAAGTDDLLPMAKNCNECHSEEDRKNCTKCHPEGAAPAALPSIVDYSPKFNHAAHVKQGIKCDRCHPGVAESDSSSASHLPPMEPCMVCHDGVTADKSCIVCHDKPEGKLPENHKPQGWAADHVFAYTVGMGESCKMCHSNQQCQRCHLDWILLKP